MALYIRRPNFAEERISRGMQSQLHASDYFFIIIVDDENEKYILLPRMKINMKDILRNESNTHTFGVTSD